MLTLKMLTKQRDHIKQMKEVAEQGIDRSSVEAFVNRIEFHLRER